MGNLQNDSRTRRTDASDRPAPFVPPEPPPAETAAVRGASAQRRRRRELAFVPAAVVLVLGLLELLLRVAGFEYAPVPILVDTTWGPDQIERLNAANQRKTFQPDDLTFWSLIPGLALDDRTVNERGLLNAPLVVPKPRATYRILCLGDSCTAMGSGSYPAVLQNRLDLVARPDRRFEVINGGVFSYSSCQGLRLYRRRLNDLEPDLVTVYFGWNDHFLTRAYSDNSLGARDAPAPAAVRVLRWLRLYQLEQRLVNWLQLQAIARQRAGRRLYRVNPDEYRENLEGFVAEARRQGARPLLLTAPGNHGPGRVPAYYLRNGLAESEESMIRLHRQYNDITRATAARAKADLLDLDREFDRGSKDDLFVSDGIHPNARGRHLIARLLLEDLGRLGILSDADERRIAAQAVYDSKMPNLLRSRIEFRGAPLRIAAGTSWTLAVRAANTGDTIWLARPRPPYGMVELGVIVYDAEGRRVGERERGRLPRDLKPGEAVELRWSCAPLDKAGEYVLEVDPVAEFVSWFNQAGDERTTTALTVTPGR